MVGLVLAASACEAGGSGPAASPGSDAASSTSTSASAAQPTDQPRVGDLDQLVEIRDFGIGFAIPKDWTTLETQDVALQGRTTRRAARLLGISPEQVVQGMRKQGLQTFSIAPRDPDELSPDMVTTARLQGGWLTDDRLEQRLTASGAKLGPFRHPTTAVGQATAVTFVSTPNRLLLHGQVLVVDVGADAVIIVVLSVNSARPFTVEQQIERTLQRL